MHVNLQHFPVVPKNDQNAVDIIFFSVPFYAYCVGRDVMLLVEDLPVLGAYSWQWVRVVAVGWQKIGRAGNPARHDTGML